MKVNLENLNPGTWFDFEDGGRICLKTLSIDEATKIQRESTKTKIEYKNNNRFQYEEVNEEKQFDLTWDAIIVDWEGIEKADGKPVECTRENKVKLMREYPAFVRIVTEFLQKLSDAETIENKESEKN